MLSETSLSYISFIHYFFIPIISLRIYCKRHSLHWAFSIELFYQYVVMCLLILPAGRICASVVERITATSILAESTKYTIIAIVAAVVIPYAREAIEKFVKIDVEITKEKKQDKREKKNEN